MYLQVFTTYNPMQNIWNKLEKSSKTGQDKKSLISTFACFLTATAIVSFLEGRLGTAGGIFFTRWWEPDKEWLWWFENFSKLKTAFCEYWTSIKTKISVICVSKEYECKTKMVEEQWLQIKKTFLFFYWVELTFGGSE